MEQVSQTSDYCKHCSAPLIPAPAQYSNSTHDKDDQYHLAEQTQLCAEVEGIVNHYLKSARITDQSGVDHLTQRVMLQSKSLMKNNTGHELMQHAIQIAQEQVQEHYATMGAHNATPVEQPTSMSVQDLDVGLSHSKRHLKSLNTVFNSVYMAIQRRR